MQVAVIGSGPAGFACANALIRRGLKPTLIDAGETLPAERQTVVDAMSATDPAAWSPEQLEYVSGNPRIAKGKLQKFVFGSEFCFARNRDCSPEHRRDELPSATFALGGYTVAWGAAVLPAEDSDLQDWPIKRSDLEPSYRQVLNQMPLCGENDSLETAFPLFKQGIQALPIGDDARALLNRLQSVGREQRVPLVCGRARLAVDASRCQNCGLCLSGCVYGAIYTTGPKVLELHRSAALRYVSGLIVQRIEETNTGVRIEMLRLRDQTVEHQEFDRVFVAAGALQSTRIMLASLDRYDEPVTLRDSQKFVLPILCWRRTPLAWPHIPSLASMFVDFKLPELSNHWIHAQISGTNDYVLRRFGIRPWTDSFRRRAAAPLYERLLVAWCGLHSDHSSSLELQLTKPGQPGRSILEMRAVHNPQAPEIVRMATRRLGSVLRSAGAWAISRAMVLGVPGVGNHFGGSLPMRSNPRSALDTDVLGRPSRLKRVHVVDGSILPSIPATTLVLLQMANADRIATAAELN